MNICHEGIVSIFDTALNVLKLICITLCWLWFRSLFEIGICYLFGGFACEDLISRVLFNDSSWCAFDVLHGIRFVWGVISSFHPILVHLKWYCKIHFFQFLVLHLERKEKNIYGFTLMYAHGTQCFTSIFRFFHTSVCLLFDVFPRVEKFDPLLDQPFLFSTPLHPPISISSSAFLFPIERVSCINIHVQNNFSFFFSLSLKLFFFLVPAKP